MNTLSQIPAYVWRLLFAAALVAVMLMTEARAADYARATQVVAAQADSWIFARSRYTHDPDTGARVAQYERIAPVEPLPDQREITSIYSRSRSVLRGADGSTDTYYRVRSYGNGRGGLDAEWERFHDSWRGARVSGGAYQGYGYGGGFGGRYSGYGPGYGGGNPGVGPGPGDRGYEHHVRPRHDGYGPGYGRPDAGTLDPDATDGYRDPRPRTPDRRFFNQGFGHEREPHEEHEDHEES